MTGMFGRFAHIARFRGAALIGMMIVAGCSTLPAQQSRTSLPLEQDRSGIIPATAEGSFLAGHVAQSIGDWDAAAALMEDALHRDKGNNALQKRAFLLALGAGNNQKALDLARQLQQSGQKPLHLSQMLLIADAVKKADYTGAHKILNQIDKDGVGVFINPAIEAWLLVAEGKDVDGLAMLDKLKPYGGFDAFITLHRGLMLEYRGQIKPAQDAFEKARGLSNTLRTVHALAGFYARHDMRDKALELYKAFGDGDKGETLLTTGYRRLLAGGKAPAALAGPAEGIAAALFDLASVLQNETSNEATLLYTQAALDIQPDFPLAQLLLGDLLFFLDRSDEARQTYEKINPASDIHLAVQLRLSSLFEHEKKYPEAIAAVIAVLPDYDDLASLHARVGDLYRAQEKFVLAIDAYNAALARIGKVEARHWPLFYARGISYERLKKWPEAEADLKRALELSPDQPAVLNYLGYTWADQGNNLEKARDMIAKAVQLKPDDGYITDSLGWVLYRMKDYANSVTILERAVALVPVDQVVNDHLGDALWHVGRKMEAVYQWQRALTMGDDRKIIDRIKDKLESGLDVVERRELRDGLTIH